MKNKEIDKLNDLFARYLLGRNGNEDILIDLVNSALKDFNFEEVKDLEIIDPFNLSENIELKESIIDIKAKTKDNQTVIIEVQLCGNIDFVKRIFYYMAKNIVNEVKEGEDYDKVQRIISINLINFNLDFGDKGKAHRCFKLIDTESQNISLDLIQMHILEVKRFINIIKKSSKEEIKKNKLLSWMKFFTSKNLSEIEEELKEENKIMSKVIEEYKRFTSDEKLMRAYDARDAFLLGQGLMLKREREEGIKERNYAIAKTMKTKNMDIKLISEITGLSIEEIKKLK